MSNSNSIQLNGVFQEDTSNTLLSLPDSNANLNNQSKGAIPKTKSVILPKKSTKINNNVEDLVVESDRSGDNQLNGFTNSSLRKRNFLDDYSSNNKCENCSVDTCNISNTINHDVFKSFQKDENLCGNSSDKISSFQSIPCSSRDVDLDFQLNLDIDSSSSSEDNELLSISDDGCIYTYKGDHAADLPSSFFNLEIPALNPMPEVQNRDDNASPEMDYLEMDFDPGPSGDGDSDTQSNADLENAENLPQDLGIDDCERLTTHSPLNNDSRLNNFNSGINSTNNNAIRQYNGSSPVFGASAMPSTSALNVSQSSTSKQFSATASVLQRLQKLKMPWSCSYSQRTVGSSSIRFSLRHHTSNGELSLTNEKLFLNDYTAKDYHDKNKGTLKNRITKFLLWSEEEANRKQVVQIGASACGATAVLNVLKALRFPVPPLEKIKEAVHTNLRANSSPLTEYLLSRSKAGSTHTDLINGLDVLTENKVYSRFFSMFPERMVNLNLWLYFWMSHGAVPIATLNLQKCSGSIPDAWHHQMIFGVNHSGVYLTNPLECVKSSYLWPQLCSESVLLVKRDDILSRWNVKRDLKELMKIEDDKWNSLNVIGQIANMVRENRREQRLTFAHTSHVKIPAAYSSGITLVIRKDSPYYRLLLCCPELPLLPYLDEEASCSRSDSF